MSVRGQTFTLEAFVAAILIVATVAFALQAVTITSNTASGADAELRGQHAGLVGGALDRAVERGELQTTLVYWNESDERFYGADEDDGRYVSQPPNTTFGESLETVVGTSQVRYNVDLHYQNESGDREVHRLVEYGSPSDDAVRVVETVTLYDDTPLVYENETVREDVTLGDLDDDPDGTFYAPNAAEDSAVYNVIRVEVVIWQT